MGSRKVIDEVVGWRTHVVQTLPHNKSEFGGGVLEDLDLDELVSSLRIEFSINSVRAWIEPPTPYPILGQTTTDSVHSRPPFGPSSS
jgi:hypothetical protein